MNQNIKSIVTKLNISKIRSIAPSLIIIYGAMILVFSIINPLFITVGNIRSIIANLPIIGIAAVGLSVVMITGNIDLSIESVIGVATVICAKMYNIEGFTVPIAFVILLALLAGAIIGAINGFMVTVLRIESIIVTLGTMAIFRGLAYVFAKESAKIYYKPFIAIGRKFVFGFIPLPFIYLIVIIIVMYFILKYTKFGRNLYSVGANSNASRLVGINNRKNIFFAFVISGCIAALSGVLMASQLAFGQGVLGEGSIFQILTICVLGGISFYGGRGTLVGLFLAMLIIGSISNGLILIGVPINWRLAAQGVILISAILLDSLRTRKKSF